MKPTFLLSSSPPQSVLIWGFRMAAQRVCQRSAQTFGPAAARRGRGGRGQVRDTGHRTRSDTHTCVLPLSYSNPSVPLLPSSAGVMQWVTQGLTKVLPQPDDKYKETEDKQEEHTEVSCKLKLEAKAGS